MADPQLPVEEEVLAVREGLSKEQKIGFILLLVFAIITVTLGALQIRNTLYSPFALNNKVPVSIKDEVTSIDSLRFRDTDNDGLSDYDELYKYGTSQYLADTDSDGIKDSDEVKQGTNPLCAEGKECSAQTEDLAGVVTTSALVASTQQALGPVPTELNDLLTNPAQLRQALIASGVDAKVVSQVSDADLLSMVQDIIKSNTSTANQIQLLNSISKISSSSTR